MEIELAKELRKVDEPTDILVNAWANLADEKSVSSPFIRVGGYNIHFAPGYRLMESKDHQCLVILISEYEWVTVSIDKEVTIMHMFADNKIDGDVYSRNTVYQGCRPLVYFILYMWEQYTILNKTYCLEFLTGLRPSKPFTTHFVFSPKTFHEYRQKSTFEQVLACCDMYGDFMEEFGFSNELVQMKPWSYSTKKYWDGYNQLINYGQYKIQRVLDTIASNSNIPRLIDMLNKFNAVCLVNEGYIFFMAAYYQNRQDIATWLWYSYALNPRILMENVEDQPYNKVTEFVYSLVK